MVKKLQIVAVTTIFFPLTLSLIASARSVHSAISLATAPPNIVDKCTLPRTCACSLPWFDSRMLPNRQWESNWRPVCPEWPWWLHWGVVLPPWIPSSQRRRIQMGMKLPFVWGCLLLLSRWLWIDEERSCSFKSYLRRGAFSWIDIRKIELDPLRELCQGRTNQVLSEVSKWRGRGREICDAPVFCLYFSQEYWIPRKSFSSWAQVSRVQTHDKKVCGRMLTEKQIRWKNQNSCAILI